MIKTNKFEELLKCKLCHETFKSPVVLPCYETICAKDLTVDDNGQIKCFFCNEHHTSPAKGFPVDKRTQDFLDLFYDQLIHSSAYKTGKIYLDELEAKFKQVDSLEQDPFNYIYEYFLDIKTKVDIRREEMKLEIDSYSDKLIGDLKRYESECKDCLDKVAELSKDLKASREVYEEIRSQFEDFNLVEKNLLELNIKGEELNKTVASLIHGFKKTLMKNMSYEFKSVPVNVENIFGQIKCTEEASLSDSKILSKADRTTLLQLCNFSEKQNWKLLYSGKKDGFEADDFHSKCDGKRQTLTIIKTTGGFVFGGYTNQDWAQVQPEGHFKFDPNAFIFSLINKLEKPLIVKCNEPAKAIFCADNYGPIFGNWPHDIVIDTNSNLLFENYCNLSFSYKYYEDGADFFLAGNTCDFRTEDIEVFGLES